MPVRKALVTVLCAFVVLSTPVFAEKTANKTASDDPQKNVLTVGIVPQQSATKLARLWSPILRYVSKHSGYNLHFRTAPTIPKFEERVAAGEYDLAYMNPYHYTVFHEKPGYIAFAKRKNKKIKGIMVTRKDNPIEDMRTLAGQTLAFPAPAAFAASILTRAWLAQNDISITPRYVSSHDSVYRAVAHGLMPVGGGIMRTFNNVDPKIREQLRVLWISEGFTPHAFAAHPRVSKTAMDAVAKVFIEMFDNQEGKELLLGVSFKNGLQAAENKDWDDVRALGLDLLESLISGEPLPDKDTQKAAPQTAKPVHAIEQTATGADSAGTEASPNQ